MIEANDLAEMIETAARTYKRKQAVYFEGKSIAYGDVNEQANKLANGLAGIGIEQGDRVALMLPNVPEFVYSFFAIQKLGAIAVPFNTMYKGREITHILNDCGAKALITLANFVSLINEVRPEVPTLEHVILTGERTLLFVHPEATYALQMVFEKADIGDTDTVFTRVGEAITEVMRRLGVEDAWYKHRGSVRVKNGRKIANFLVTEMENLAVVNALCFVGPLPSDELFKVVWVPAEIKDKVVEPLTSVEQITGSRPTVEQFRDIAVDVFSNALSITVEPGNLKRDELFGYEKTKAQASKAV